MQSGRITCDEVRSGFPPLLLRKYRKLARSPISARKRRYIWRGRGNTQDTNACVADFVSHFINGGTGGNNKVCSYKDGVLLSHYGSSDSIHWRSLRGRRKQHDKISRGGVLQMLVSNVPPSSSTNAEVQLLSLSCDEGVRTFWVVRGLYSDDSGIPLFSQVSQMCPVSGQSSFKNQYTLSEEQGHYVVRLFEHVRRVLALPDSDDSSKWTLLGTVDGYPPRSR